MVATMATLGEIVDEYVNIEKLMCYMPQQLKQIALLFSTLMDVCSLTITNLAGRLRVVEEALEELSLTLLQDGRLYLMEEE
jgi:hypothetical protein